MSDNATQSMALVNAQVQTAYDNYISTQLQKLSGEEQDVAKRILDIKHLLKEMEKYRKDTDEGKNVSMTDLSDHIERFQEEHFPAICNENKSVVTEDQNPFPEGLELDNISPNDLALCEDKLHTLVEQEQNAMTHITRDLLKHAENHHHVTLMAAQAMQGLTKLEDELVRKQTESR